MLSLLPNPIYDIVARLFNGNKFYHRQLIISLDRNCDGIARLFNGNKKGSFVELELGRCIYKLRRAEYLATDLFFVFKNQAISIIHSMCEKEHQ